MLRVTHMRSFHMDQDRFTQSDGDLEGFHSAKICKSSGSIYRQASMDIGQLPEVITLFPSTSAVQKRPY